MLLYYKYILYYVVIYIEVFIYFKMLQVNLRNNINVNNVSVNI